MVGWCEGTVAARRACRRGLAVAVVVLAAAAASAETSPAGDDVLFRADELTYDTELGIVVARGAVEFIRGERILLADQVTYNRRADLVTAIGNVVLLDDPTGNVYFAEFVELTGDLADGVAEQISARLADDSRLAAAGARRTGGRITEFRRGVYSPCPLCPDDPERAPTWQVKAERITHDEATRDLVYRDVTLEMWGVPVLYIPWFSHPDPTVERRSGFLTPTVGRDSQLGYFTQTPYFIAIAPDKDATVTPMVMTGDYPALFAEYRQRFARGELATDGSVTYARREIEEGERGRALRGHFNGRLRYDIDDTWRGGADARLTTDDTYLRRYGISNERALRSRAFLEGFRGRSYAALNARRFQDLREGGLTTRETPLILPMLDYNYVSEPDVLGGRWSADANLMVLTRFDGADSRRLSLITGWRRPWTTRSGQVITPYASLQSDAYWVDGVAVNGRTESGFAGRLFPQAGIEWRWPWARPMGRGSAVIEPVANLIAAPVGINPRRIPNEDSLDFELDDTNVIGTGIFPGRDRVEGGVRAQYGVRLALHDPWPMGHAEAFLGHSWRFTGTPGAPEERRLGRGASDLVGRVQASAGPFADFIYRFRLDQRDLAFRRHEVTARVGPRPWNLALTYLKADRSDSGAFAPRHEVDSALTYWITRNWAVGGRTRWDLEERRALRHSAAITYEDDCFLVTLDYSRSYARDRDFRPSHTVTVRVHLLTLGSFEVSPGL